MPRIPLVNAEDVPEDVRKFLEALPVQLNIFRMAANAETMFRPLFSLGTSILGRQQLDDKIRELVILDAVRVVGGEYEWVQHVAIAKAVGSDDDEVDAIARGDMDADCFDEREKDILAFAHTAAEHYRAPDEVFGRARKHLSPREITELLLTIGFYQMLGRLTEATATELDEAVGTKVIDSVRR